MSEERNYFAELVNLDVSKWTEKKQQLDYLQWAAAITLMRTRFPKSYWITRENENGIPWFVDPVSNTGVVKIKLVIPEIEYELEEPFPIMDMRYKSLIGEAITSDAANKANRRCLVKLIGEATGIGLNLYNKSDDTMDEREVELSREKLSEIYKKKIKLGDEAKKNADVIVAETNEAINSAADDSEKLNIYADARKKMLAIRK